MDSSISSIEAFIDKLRANDKLKSSPYKRLFLKLVSSSSKSLKAVSKICIRMRILSLRRYIWPNSWKLDALADWFAIFLSAPGTSMGFYNFLPSAMSESERYKAPYFWYFLKSIYFFSSFYNSCSSLKTKSKLISTLSLFISDS